MSTNTTTATPANGTTVRSEAEDALWAALAAQPGSSTSELADAASVPKVSARKILTGWAGTGLIVRDHSGDDPRAGHRWIIRDTTTATEPDIESEPEIEAPAPESDTHASAAPADSDPATAPGPDAEPPALDADTSADAGDPGSEQTGDHPAAERAPVSPSAETAAPADGPCPTCGRPLPKSNGPRPGELRGMVEDFLRDHPDTEFTPGKIAKELNRSSGAIYNALFVLVGKFVAVQTCERPHTFKLHPDQNQ